MVGREVRKRHPEGGHREAVRPSGKEAGRKGGRGTPEAKRPEGRRHPDAQTFVTKSGSGFRRECIGEGALDAEG